MKTLKIHILHTLTQKTQALSFETTHLTVGKKLDADIYLNDPEVSRSHAVIYWKEKEWIYEDTQSTNGSFLKDKKILIHPLQNNDVICAGPYALKFEICEAKKAVFSKLHFMPQAEIQKRLSKNPELYGFLENKTLQSLMKDPEISEIMLKGENDLFIEKQGQIQKIKPWQISNAELNQFMDQMLTPLGRHVDEASPVVDGRLPDGSRLNIVMPPIALQGPVITIRKFQIYFQTLEDLIQNGTLPKNMQSFLENQIQDRKNILISGGTSSGKTTFLNILASCIPEEERILTIEDAAELHIQKPHVISLEARPSNLEGKGEMSIRTLVQTALRMRPDRLIIGECRGAETFDMLQAMNTGHKGCLTTCHSNSTRDALKRIETLALLSGLDLPLQAIREMVVSAIDTCIHLERLPHGKRKLKQVSQLIGLEGQVYQTEEIYPSTKGASHVIDTHACYA